VNYSAAGLALTKQSEGCRLTAYQDAVGVWTIGYGHTSNVQPGDTCTEDQASEWLAQDVQWAVDAVNKYVTVKLNQGQFDALVDFTFNLGVGNLTHSTLLRKLNAGDYAGAAAEFPKWNMAGGRVLAGLVARRAAEQAMFQGDGNGS
jgi:lysozyme